MFSKMLQYQPYTTVKSYAEYNYILLKRVDMRIESIKLNIYLI